MEQVLLIDDEVYVRQLEKYLIHWEELGIQCAGEFESPLELIEYVKEHPVDIIISDIMMPEMDGLELAEQVRKYYPKCQFVIVSGYRDFDFAKRAVKLGVKDYLVKPINEKEINEILLEIVNTMRQTQKVSNEDIPYRQKLARVIAGEKIFTDISVINEKYHTFFAMDGIFRVLHLGFCNYNEEQDINQAASMVITNLSSSIKNFCYDLEAVQTSDIRYEILLQIKPDMDETVLRLLETSYKDLVRRYGNMQDLRFYVSLGKAVSNPAQIKESTDSAHFFLSGRLGYGNTRIYIADILPNAEKLISASHSISYQDARSFDRYLDSANEEGIRKTTRKLFDEIQNSQTNYIFYYYLCFDLLERLTNVLKQHDVPRNETDKLKEKLSRIMDNCDTVKMLRYEMERICVDSVNKYLTSNRDSKQVYVQFAKNYIEEHYAEEVTLQIIADLAHINSAYLSNIFKKATGVNYQTYLTEVRIEKAKRLLCDLDMNLTQIANAVGYNSTRYFSKMFEQETGMKPSEYRRTNLRKARHE